jgi:S1-C subfamily serine protease
VRGEDGEGDADPAPSAARRRTLAGSIPAGDGGPPTVAVPVVDARRDGAVGPPRLRRRHRVLPRTVLGLTSMILAFAIGAGFSGAVLYSYYQYRLDQNTTRVNALVDGYRTQFTRAEGDLDRATAAAKAQIRQALEPVQHLEAGPDAQAALVRRLGPSLFFVTTQDADGRASVGTAFVVASTTDESLLLTSYTTIQAATTVPGPAVYVRQGADGASTRVDVRTWDASRDLALIVLPRGGLRPVQVAGPGTAQLGQPVYALAGIGGVGASIAQGEIDDVSSVGIADDVPIGTAFQGGPVVDASGAVLAVASRTYAPLGYASDGVRYAPFVDAACSKVLDCPSGRISSSR